MLWGRGGDGERLLHGRGCFFLGEDGALEPDGGGDRTMLHVLSVSRGITSQGRRYE